MAADRAINMALRVLGVGEVERDFKRVGSAGERSFAEVKKAANGAAQEVSEYTARLRRTVQQAKADFANLQQLNKGSPERIRETRNGFIAERVRMEQDKILTGVPEATRELDLLDGAATRSGVSLRTAGLLGAAAGIALLKMGDMVREAFVAFIDSEAAMDRFQAKLKLSGNASLATASDIEAMAERIEQATSQTAEHARDAALSLATVPGLSQQAMEEGLTAASRFADAIGTDVVDVITDRVSPVLLALAERDMKAVFDATDGLDPVLRVTIQRLAEAGQTAEAQQALFKGLADAAGNGPNGLTRATNELDDAWRNLKIAFAERFAGTAVAGLELLTGFLRSLRNEAKMTREEYDGLKASAQSTSYLGGLFTVKRLDTSKVGQAPAKPGGSQSPSAATREAAAADARARAEIKAMEKRFEEAAKKDRPSRSPSPPPVTSAEVARLLKQEFGVTVTSTDRTREQNRRAGGAVGSYHVAGRAVDFVPRGGMGALSKDQIRGFLESQGIDIKELLGPGDRDHNDHFHVAFGKSRLGPEQMAQRDERAEQEAARRAQQVVTANQQLDDQLLAAKRANTDDVASLADMSRKQLQVETDRQLAAIAAKEATGDYTAAEAALMAEKTRQLSAEQLRTIDAEEAAALANQRRQAEDEAFQTWLAANDTQRELLAMADAMATTQAERRSIQLELLELDYREERTALERILATEQDLELRQRAADRLAALDRVLAGRVEDALRRTAGPAEGFLRDLNANAAAQGDRIEGVYIDALGGLSDDLASAIVNFERLDEVAQKTLQNIATRLLSIGIEQQLVKPLAEALFPEAAAAAGQDPAAAAAGLTAAGGTLTAAGGALTGASGALTGSAQMWLATALQIQASAAALAAANAAGALGDGGGGGHAGILNLIGSAAANNPGFAGGTDSVPTGIPFWVGENGREKMMHLGGGRLMVQSNERVRRSAESGGSGTMVVNNISIPPRADPRRVASGVARATQGSLARSTRKGLAMAGGNRRER